MSPARARAVRLCVRKAALESATGARPRLMLAGKGAKWTTFSSAGARAARSKTPASSGVTREGQSEEESDGALRRLG